MRPQTDSDGHADSDTLADVLTQDDATRLAKILAPFRRFAPMIAYAEGAGQPHILGCYFRFVNHIVGAKDWTAPMFSLTSS